ncbi:Gfo/Idh/MocA family protein [Oceaniglobus ichthyenteri]|uniref:Gfo/Idh/MocA family protein n=1 Tax=Oceaniglobus ichthyenteri TaxID=2136177 RepID=UPI000D37C7E7|nr:Gfo/Idh/MocA family oxidoreductase [Oceaniglobus ichthyenteri]
MATNIALVGIGKIAQDQHVPSLTASPDWALAATVSRSGTVDGIQSFTDFDQMLAERGDIPVVSLCLPPVPRFDYAQKALRAGRHVMLEKPPGATLAEVHALADLAANHGVTLYTTWHSRMAAGVETARAFLADKTVDRAHITWKEDVKKWHPGQDWVFEPGGMGVFDPGSNALSILTHILPAPVHVTKAVLEYPENRQTPIAAQVQFSGNISGDFDWRQTGPQSWNIDVEAGGHTLRLSDGGAKVVIDGTALDVGPNREYPNLYAEMARLVAAGQSDVDLAPMVHIADALTLGRRVTVAPFTWQ